MVEFETESLKLCNVTTCSKSNDRYSELGMWHMDVDTSVFSRPWAGFQRVSPGSDCVYVRHAETNHENHSARIPFAHRCGHPNRFGAYFPALEVRCHEPNTRAVTIPSRDEVETLAALTL